MTIYDDKRSAELLAAELQAELEESATDPTTAQPATPGEALRWAAERITARLAVADVSDHAAVALLGTWARDLDAAPATPLDIAARALLRKLDWPEGDLLVQLDEAYGQAHQLGLAVWELTGSTEDDAGLESAGTVLQRAGVLLEAPAAPASPALPPEHQPGMDPDWCGYMAGKAAEALRQLGHTGLADHVEHLERAHAAGNPEHLYGPAGPLSSVPPAGTEGDG